MAGNSNSGRRPLPTKLKIIQGTDKPCRANEYEPEPPPLTRHEPPAHLTDVAREHWLKIAPVLVESKILARIDVDTLAAYCECFATWVQAKDEVAESGSVVRTERGGFQINPAMKVARSAYTDMVRIAGEFGMTPSSRSRLSTKATDTDPAADATDGGAADRLLG